MIAQIPNLERAIISCLREKTMGYVQPMIFCQKQAQIDCDFKIPS